MNHYVRRAIALIGVAGSGLGLSLWTEILHRRIVADRNYASFCNLNSQVDCSTVLGSKWAELFGVSVSTLAIAYYLAAIAMAIGVVFGSGSTLRRRLGNLLLLQSVGGLGFSLYMAVVALAVLGTVCLMCTGLYVVAVLNFVTAWRLRSILDPVGSRQAAERSGSDRRIAILGTVAVGLILVILGWKVLAPEPLAGTAQSVRAADPNFFNWYSSLPFVQVDASGRNQLGPADAPITIVEFSDFECGHCNNFHRSVDEVWAEQKQNIRIVFRHFPLSSDCNAAVPKRFHPSACVAAVASECAAEQGRFWDYHELLFRNQQQLDRESLLGYAQQLGLDRSKFVDCLSRPETLSRVEDDARAGSALGIKATPTVFINGRMVTGALDAADLRKALVLARDVPK